MSKFYYLAKEKAQNIPKTPGVYSFRNARGILYIGKAANLQVRVKNHFNQPTWQDNNFVDQATHIGYIKTDSEIEALLLESQLIKKYQPRYNIMLRDDKQYFYVGFSRAKLPILRVTHQPNTSPPTPLSLVRRGGARGGEVVIGPFTDGGALKTVLRYIRKIFPYYTQAHRKLPCSYCHIGLCPGPNPSVREYKKNIVKIKAILNGKKPRVITSIKKEMAKYAKNLDFEKAAKARDQMTALENIFAHKHKFEARSTKFETNYNTEIQNSKRFEFRISNFEFSSLEAYDISNIQGKEPVASMVRFDNGKPNKSHYRKFRIRLPEKSNDVAMIKEVIRRRLTHPEWPYPDVFLIDGGKAQLNAALHETTSPPLPLSLPRRGGRGEVVALAKRLNELYLPDREKPIPLSSIPKDLAHLLMYARDEAHRFAISYHRKLHRQTFK